MSLQDIIAPIIAAPDARTADQPPTKRAPGRPFSDGPAMLRKQISLTGNQWAALEALDPAGKGNASRAVAHLLALAAERAAQPIEAGSPPTGQPAKIL